MLQTREQITPREAQEQQWEAEARDAHFAHEKEMKAMDIEIQRLEAKISSWYRLPISILKLPVWLLFGFAYVVAMIRKHEPSQDFWRYLK